MRKAVFIVLVLIVTVPSLFAQLPQMERSRRRMDALIQSDEDRQHDQRLAEADRAAALPVPKRAVMNVDVQMVLSKADVKTFAEAKAAEAKKVTDGEPLWMYVKIKSKLGDYVLTTRNPDDPEKLRYTIYAEVAPRGDVTALHQFAIQFAKEDLPATEFMISLAPALFGRNKSIPVFLTTSNGINSGVWNNEIRLTNSLAIPRALTDNLAAAPVTLDFSAGSAKYRKLFSDYDSIILRGTTDLTKLPAPGTFFSEPLKAQLSTKLTSEGIQPIRIYFSGDDWQESASFVPSMKRTRKVFATFTYRRAEQCYYGVAEIAENFDLMNGKFAEAEINLQKDLAVPCTEIG